MDTGWGGGNILNERAPSSTNPGATFYYLSPTPCVFNIYELIVLVSSKIYRHICSKFD